MISCPYFWPLLIDNTRRSRDARRLVYSGYVPSGGRWWRPLAWQGWRGQRPHPSRRSQRYTTNRNTATPYSDCPDTEQAGHTVSHSSKQTNYKLEENLYFFLLFSLFPRRDAILPPFQQRLLIIKVAAHYLGGDCQESELWHKILLKNLHSPVII